MCPYFTVPLEGQIRQVVNFIYNRLRKSQKFLINIALMQLFMPRTCRITAVMEVETDIISIITASQIIFVESYKTDIIVLSVTWV